MEQAATQYMTLGMIDWIIIAAYFIISLAIGLCFTKRAGESMEEYFVSGRSLPWWLAGTSMVATTFAADTPLAVTGLVISKGIAGNWLWWAYALGGMITVFVYARLWRRARVMTDVELIDLRYDGKPAKFLRVFRSLYLAIPINCLIVGWVTSAIVKVMHVTLGVDQTTILVASMVITGVYATLSGMWGVTLTDFIQFIIAMFGCVMLAIFAVGKVGGLSALATTIQTKYGPEVLDFVPNFKTSGEWMPLSAFFVYIFVIWWASWYPGAEPGGGGYIVQRMASCKDEKHSILATLWFTIAHYALRPWPWILVALCALVMFPELKSDPKADANAGFPMVMAAVLTPGYRGLLIVTFFAAFMSTLATQINWGASYVINDFYKPYIKPGQTDRHYASVSRIATGIILIIGGVVSTFITSVEQAWQIMLTIGAGTGMVFMLRWFWWRINAWTEISAMIASLVIGTLFMFDEKIFGQKIPTQYQILLTAGSTMIIWIVVTFITPPEPMEKLTSFYKKVHPVSIGWGPVKKKCPEVEADNNLGISILAAFLSSFMIFSILNGVGRILLGDPGKGFMMLGLALVFGAMVYVLFSKHGWKNITK